jgi:hypothetical protein
VKVLSERQSDPKFKKTYVEFTCRTTIGNASNTLRQKLWETLQTYWESVQSSTPTDFELDEASAEISGDGIYHTFTFIWWGEDEIGVAKKLEKHFSLKASDVDSGLLSNLRHACSQRHKLKQKRSLEDSSNQ